MVAPGGGVVVPIVIIVESSLPTAAQERSRARHAGTMS
jgi:hypothetical protein